VKVLSWEELVGGRLSGLPFAATIGVFDGLHIGHRALVSRILGEDGLVSAVLTFAENPKRLLSPSTYQGGLSTLRQKLELIESMGVDYGVLIDFSGDFSKLPGRLFLSILRDCGELRYLAVGSNFRCGRGLDTDAEGIRDFCGDSIGVELLDPVKWAGSEVSSSRIRKAILEGRLDEAARMLGRPYEIDLRDAEISQTGLAAPRGDQALPPRGVYEASLASDSGRGRSELRVLAEIDAEGRWSVDGPGWAAPGAPLGLALIRLVSRV
jgi:riboflavin kinase/FMN adenylyltransferase